MSEFRNRVKKRVMAVIVSGTLFISNLTGYAAETVYDTDIEEEYSETVFEDREPAFENTVTKETEYNNEEEEPEESEKSVIVAAEDERNRPEWGGVTKPTISDISLDHADKTKIKVTVDALIGSDGADKVVVYMYDEEGKEAGSVESVEEQTKTILTFFMDSSGSYTFRAVISRDDEEHAIESEISAPFAFQIPLTVPSFRTAESLGGGKIELKWKAVTGAEKYVIEIAGDKTFEPKECTGFSAVVEGLTIGENYQFTVYAIRGEEKTEKSEPIECEATESRKVKWTFSSYGVNTSISEDANGYEVLSDDSVRVWSLNNRGKIVPTMTDGIAFYYTTINPETTNFTFTTTAHVNKWTYSNGQEGFGVMVADSIGENGSSEEFWNNCYQAVVSRISYKWNGTEVSTDGSGMTILMCLGVGATEKIGVTSNDISKISAGTIREPKNFMASQAPLDTTFAKYGEGRYNMVGNCTNSGTIIDSSHEQYVNYELQIQKNNSGYFISYTQMDDDGNYILDKSGEPITTTKKYYDVDALNVLEEDLVYVGVFASRNADVTFTNMKLTTISPEDDRPAETRPVKYVNGSNTILSGSVTNTDKYQFVFESNWNGRLVLKDSAGNILTKYTEKDNDGKDVETDYYNVTGTLDVAISKLPYGNEDKNTKVYFDIEGLSVGKNVFTVEFTPDKDWSPEIDAKTNQKLVVLENYDKVIITHTVEYKKYGEQGQTIYVSQDGKYGNTGTKESPLDIYTAVKHAQPGQTILLAGGYYSLKQTLYIPRGINGAPDKSGGKETYNQYIKLMAADSEVRPVLDFDGQTAAMLVSGDYWYFKNFDVTGSKDGESGIQLSGSHCVFDRVDTYKNGGNGLQICCGTSTDTYKDWPSGNLILNCNSYLNADYERKRASGFATNCTSGSGNVFDGCIAAYNANAGWDLYANEKTGNIGAVTIKNCITYRNGYILLDESNNLDEFGTLMISGGSGCGFLLGSDGLAGGSIYDDDYDANALVPYSGHKLIHSLAFDNLSKGIDSNSGSNVKVYHSISFNNGKSNNEPGYINGANIIISTYNNVLNTDYELRNVISFRTQDLAIQDDVSGKGKQDISKVANNTVYYWNTDVKAAVNESGIKITEDDFVSLTYESLGHVDKTYWRNMDGTINMHGFLQLKEGVSTDSASGTSPSVGGTVSNNPIIGDDTSGDITGGVDTENPPESSGTEETGSMAGSSEPEETESISESDKTEETESVPEFSETEEAESVPESGKTEETESMPESSKTEETESIPESSKTEETESIPESSEIEGEFENGIQIIGLEASYPYTGAKIIPDIKVRDCDIDKYLTQGADYVVAYKNNTKVGIATMIVTGKGNYIGKNIAENFIIEEVFDVAEPVDLKGAKIEKIADTEYTGQAKYPAFTLTRKDGSTVMYIENKDFTVNSSPYKRKDGAPMDINVAVSNNINKGTATILVSGAKDAKGKTTSVKKTFKIAAVDLSKVNVKVAVEEATYAVKGAEPAVTVEYENRMLTGGKDYTVKYANNKKVGIGNVTIIGKGNYAKKCNPVTYAIYPLDMSEISVNAITAYDGIKVGKVKAIVVDKEGMALKPSQYTLKIYQVNDAGKTETVGEAYSKTDLLTKGRIYVQAEAKDTKNLKGKTDLTKEKAEFKVGIDISKAKFTLVKGAKQHTGSEIILEADDLKVTLKGVPDLEMGKDYKIAVYTNNINKGTATAVIKGIGDYSGTKTVKFKITSKKMLKASNSLKNYTNRSYQSFVKRKY